MDEALVTRGWMLEKFGASNIWVGDGLTMGVNVDGQLRIGIFNPATDSSHYVFFENRTRRHVLQILAGLRDEEVQHG